MIACSSGEKKVTVQPVLSLGATDCLKMLSVHFFEEKDELIPIFSRYGDLVSDLCAGGVCAAADINLGDGVHVYDSFHGGPREVIGINRANPLPLLLPAIDLLDAEGQKPIAQRILSAVERVLTERRVLTPDLGGKATTTEMGDAIIAALK